MPTDPIKIPQNVYIEDRIVGPLTLKQVIVTAIGGGFSYAIYAMLAKTYGALSLPITIMVWIPAAISVVFAFVKYNDLSMLQICLLMLERINKPGVRTWAPRRGITINIRTQDPKKHTEPTAATAIPTAKSDRIDELSAILDRTAAEREAPTTTAPAAEVNHVEDQEDLEDQEDGKETPSRPQQVIDDMQQEPPTTPRPVEPSRISVSPLERNTDTIASKVTPSTPRS